MTMVKDRETTGKAGPGAPDRAAPRLHVLQMATIFHVGGITRHVLALGDWLRGQGHAVTYAGTPGAWMDRKREAAFVPLDIHGVSGEAGGASPATRVLRLVQAAWRLRRWLAANPVDLIHAHESAPALVARLATLGLKIPVVLTYHGSEPGRIAQFGAVARRAADQTIAVSRRSAEDLATLGGVPRHRLQAIGLGLDAAPPIDPARAEALRREILGEDGDFLVVIIARLAEQKGVDVLVEVARRAAAQRPGVRFAVAGDGPLDGQVQAWAREAGVERQLRFLGRTNEPHLHLAAADLFLLTSRWEALPFTIAEAFQQGTPAVATDCGGVAELIDDSVGRVLPIGDAEGLARAVIEIADNPGLRGRMAEAALSRGAEPRFTHEFNNRRIEAVYLALAQERRS